MNRLGGSGWLLQIFNFIFGKKKEAPSKQENAEIHRKKGVLFFTHRTQKENKAASIQKKTPSHQDILCNAYEKEPLLPDEKKKKSMFLKRKLRMYNRLRSRWLG